MEHGKRQRTIPLFLIFLYIGMLWTLHENSFIKTALHMKPDNNTHSNQSNEIKLTLNSTVLNKKKYKDYDMVILYWTNVGGKAAIGWGKQTEMSTTCNISRSNKMQQKVLITADNSLRKYANALVWQVLDTNVRQIKKSHKRYNDVYLLEVHEPPGNIPRRWVSKWLSHFNLLMSYNSNSDIPIHLINGNNNALNTFDFWINGKNRYSFAEKNTAGADVLWIAKNCHANNGRQDYLRELFKYISVDSLGQCLHINPNNITIPPRSELGVDISDLVSKYKFYIAIENSQCEDYITEKLGTALKATTVPIVFSVDGTPAYARVLPEKSYINAGDFNSAKELAEYLTLVGSNEQLYNSFFQFKSNETMRQNSWNKIKNALEGSRVDNKWCRAANAVYQLHKNKQYNKTVKSTDHVCVDTKIMKQYANMSIQI